MKILHRFTDEVIADVDNIKTGLAGKDLRRADLTNVNLTNVNLSGANLSWARLSGANLTGVNLHNCLGNGKEIVTLMLNPYIVTFTREVLQVGCRRYSHREWLEFDDKIISKMGDHAYSFLRKYKDHIIDSIELQKGEK